MTTWLTLVSYPGNLSSEQQHDLTMLNDVLPIPDGPSAMGRLLSWINDGVNQGLLTDKEGHDLKLALGRAL